MKLPNGFGTCYRLQGNRRRPFVVKKSRNGKQYIIGYYSTYQEGLHALVLLNGRTPEKDCITFAGVFQRWKAEHYPRVSVSSRKSYDICFSHLSTLHDRPFSDLRFSDLQSAMDKVRSQVGTATQRKVKCLLGLLYDYAIRYDIVREDLSSRLVIDSARPIYKKVPFSAREVGKLRRSENPFAVDVLLLIYTGLRSGEYIALTRKDVSIQKRAFIIRKSKTRAVVLGTITSLRVVGRIYGYVFKYAPTRLWHGMAGRCCALNLYRTKA